MSRRVTQGNREAGAGTSVKTKDLQRKKGWTTEEEEPDGGGQTMTGRKTVRKEEMGVEKHKREAAHPLYTISTGTAVLEAPPDNLHSSLVQWRDGEISATGLTDTGAYLLVCPPEADKRVGIKGETVCPCLLWHCRNSTSGGVGTCLLPAKRL